jgi:cell division protein FtsB
MDFRCAINGHFAALRALTERLRQDSEWREHWTQALGGYRRKLATLGLAALALLFAYHVVFGTNGMIAYRHKRQEYRQLQDDIGRLQKENREIAEHNKALQSDPEAIEREARDQLRYARPNDIVVVLPGKDPAAPPSDASAQNH